MLFINTPPERFWIRLINNNVLWKKNKSPKIIVVMPAYNAESTVKATFQELPKDLISEIILVDDSSQDKTVQVAKKLSIKVYTHNKNKGYGGNQKTCYFQAMKRNPDIIVMVHPDYQYDAKLTGVLCEPLVNNRADIMLGSRIQTRHQVLRGGMPAYKYFANRFLTIVENIAMGLNLSEYHTGFRAYKADVLRKINYKKFSNDFIFDQQILISAIDKNYNISEIPVPCKYFPEASSINLARSTKYGILTLYTVLLFLINKIGFYKSHIFK